MRILIIRLSAIGDTIHCLPVANLLKSSIPGAEIAWMVEPASAPLLINNPAVDKVFVLKKKEWLTQLRHPGQWGGALNEIGAFWRSVRSEQFDVAIDMQGLMKSALCALASGAKMRLGFAHTREGAEHLMSDRYDAGDTFAMDVPVVDLNLRLADYLLCKLNRTADRQSGTDLSQPSKAVQVEFPLPSIPTSSLEKVERLSNYPDKGMVRNAVLIPGTTWDTKIWSSEKWWQLAGRLIEKMNYRICLVGGPSETSTNGEIARHIAEGSSPDSVLDLTGHTNLLDLIALYRQSHLVVGADTGPLHLAAAVHSPYVVGIYGSTPTVRNGPYGEKCHTITLDLWCQPCFEKHCPLSTTACLRDLTVEKVFSEIEDFLNLQV